MLDYRWIEKAFSACQSLPCTRHVAGGEIRRRRGRKKKNNIMTTSIIKPASLATVAAAALIAAPGVASANHVDFIVDGEFQLLLQPDENTESIVVDGDSDNILGGKRFVSVTENNGRMTSISAAKFGGVDALEFSNGTDASGTLMLSYGDFGSDSNGPLNSDFDTMWDAIDVSFLDVEGPVLEKGSLTVMVESSAGSGTSTQVVTTAGDYRFLFTDPGFADVDFNDVDTVAIRLITMADGSDFLIDSITREVVNVIPTPAALPAGLGLLGLAMLRRRRNA